MVKKSRRPQDMKRVSVAAGLSQRDSETLQKLATRHGVAEEAMNALREKRTYAAKRSIERPALPRASELREAVPAYRARAYVPNQMADRPRVTTNVDPETMKLLEQLAKQSGQSKAELLRGLIDDVVYPDGPAPVRRDVVTRKTQVIFFSKLFITALEEALDYDPKRHHNAPHQRSD
jgi:Ribbon-helix-helix protein, copG family